MYSLYTFLTERQSNIFSTKYKLIQDKNHNTDHIYKNNIIVEDKPLFTKKMPFYFPEVPITRKMHVMAFVISPLIATDKTPNICYKYLKLE